MLQAVLKLLAVSLAICTRTSFANSNVVALANRRGHDLEEGFGSPFDNTQVKCSGVCFGLLLRNERQGKKGNIQGSKGREI